MSKLKPSTTLSAMIDTDVEEDNLTEDAIASPDSNQENGRPAKRGTKTKAAAKRFTKPPSRRSSRSSAVVKSKKPPRTKAGTKRAPMKERSNGEHEEETEEVDDFIAPLEEGTVMEGIREVEPIVKRKAPRKENEKQKVKMLPKQTVAKEKDGEFEYTPTSVKTTKPVTKGNTKHRHGFIEPNSRREKVVPETQTVTSTEPSALVEDDEPIEVHRLPQSTMRLQHRARSTSAQRRQAPVGRHRAGSASDTDRASSDPILRRKLGEMTRKFESLDLKYRNLREVGVKEAEANFERLKVQSEIRAKAAQDLINLLRREVATHKALASDSSSIQKQISARDADLAKARTLTDQLSVSLTEAQNENKTLQAKLANSRGISCTVASISTKPPGSAAKVRPQNGKTIMVGSAEAAHATQVAQLKEDLYSDLTGLIMRGVEIGNDSDIYDCLQTGRNGTLHFKLAVAKNSEESYDETEFQYTPRLDSNRDQDLIAILPEYLADEICFSRANAARFYGRVVETLTRKIQTEEG